MSDINIQAQGDLTIGGDVVGRDKIVNNIQNIQQRALTAAEEASGERALETQVLAQGVSAFATRLQAIASEKSDDVSGSPYKGLIAYQLSDAEIFFGRSAAIASLLKRLGRGALTVLHSESGAGKSSLLQAGISSRLIGAGHLPLFLRPYNANPTYVIKRAFIPDLGQTPWLATAPLREFLRQVCNILGPKTRLYIILDQAEELFTQLEAEGRAEFVAELAECVNDTSLRVRWLLSMRTEFFGNLANFRPQIQDPFANDYRLSRLSRAEAGEVITEPVKRRGIVFETGLVEQLLNDLSTGANELPPPQIQLVCSGLYDNLPDGQTSITRAQYAAAGGATGILREHLARVLGRDLKPAQRPIAQRLFEALITADGHRAVRMQAELMTDFKASQLKDLTPETVQAVLNQLVDSRLLRAQEQEVNPTQSGQAYELASGLSPEMTAALTYELAHDYLLDQIKLDPDTQARKAAQELLEQETRTYERYQTLLSPERLAVVAPHRTALRLTPLAEELLAKSEAEVQREQRAEEARRQKELEDARKLAESEKRRAEEQAHSLTQMRTRNRIITAVGVLALVAAGVAGILGVISNQNANKAQIANTQAAENLSAAETQQAVAQAASTLAVSNASAAQTAQADAEFAKSTAVANEKEANRQAQIARAGELAIQAQLLMSKGDQGSNSTSVLLALEAMHSVSGLPYSDTLSAQQALHDALFYVNGIPLTGHTGPISSLAFSPEGRWLATASKGDNIALVWDMQNRSDSHSILSGHSKEINVVAFSPDGHWLATGSEDGSARLWNVQNFSDDAILFRGHAGGINTLAFSSDGSWLATGSDDTTARLWKIENPSASPIVFSGHDKRINILAFIPDGHWLATGSDDDTARLWDIQNPSATSIILSGHTQLISTLAFSPSGRWLATGSYDGATYLWNIQNLSADPIIYRGIEEQGIEQGILSLSFSPDEHWLAIGSGDNTVRLVDIQNPSADPLHLDGHGLAIYNLAFSPDGHWLATGSGDRTVRLWDVKNPSSAIKSTIILRGHDKAINILSFSPDGRWLATGSEDNTVRLWDIQNPSIDPVLLQGHSDAIYAMALSPDGHWLATGSADSTTRLWDVNNHTALVLPEGHAGPISSLAFSSDGRWLASGSYNDNTAILWNIKNPLSSPIILTEEDSILALAFSPDGKWLATGGGDHTAHLWNVNNPSESPLLLQGHQGAVSSLVFSNDGRWLATGGTRDNTARLWNMQDLNAVPILLVGHTSGINTLAFSSDGHWLATGSDDNTARLWDMENPTKESYLLSGHEKSVITLAFSPDGNWLATGGDDTTVYLWNVQNPTEAPIVLRGHTKAIFTMAFSPDSRLLATGSSDTTTRLWDMENLLGTPIVLHGHDNTIFAITFSPNGDFLATASLDATARLWRTNIDDLVQSACLAVGRNLTRAEWKQYSFTDTYRATCPLWPIEPEMTPTSINTP